MTTASVPAPRSGAAVAATAAARGASRRSAGSAGWRGYLPGGAGGAYVAAWAAGLAAWPANLPLNATAAQTAASYAGHPAQATVQYLLVEGLAGVLLGIVLGCAVRAQAAGPAWARARGAAVLGAIAVAVSLAQCVIGLALVAAATGHDVARCGDLSDLVNRLDGVKMLALATAGACLAAISRPAPALPRWLRAVTVPFGIALIASGYAYLTLSQALAWTTYVSGPLLLLWVAGLGITLTGRRLARSTADAAGGIGGPADGPRGDDHDLGGTAAWG
jgi:hypothetical protein